MWSKLVGNTVGIVAEDYYNKNACEYHDWSHIMDGYDYFEENKITYNEDLDYAWLYHDIVYDNKPEKEKRSKELMLEQNPSRHKAADILMATADHSIKGRDWQSIVIIKADLHQLADPAQAFRNYSKIMDESVYLYDITEQEFAQANRKFMSNLSKTVYENFQESGDPFWRNVQQGVQLTLFLSEALEFRLGKIVA